MVEDLLHDVLRDVPVETGWPPCGKVPEPVRVEVQPGLRP